MEGREFFYIEIDIGESFDRIIDEVLTIATVVPLPIAGGVIEEKARLLLDNKISLLAISYKGDTIGWRAKFVSYCNVKGRKWGVVKTQQLELSDGVVLQLGECQIVFDN